jgi:hypothetical protein
VTRYLSLTYRGITIVKKEGDFIKAYHDFRDSIDFSKRGILPDLENLVWYMLMGVPRVPADDDPESFTSSEAIDQRVNILKVTFVEVNRNEPDDFLNQGLIIYDRAAKKAKILIKDEGNTPQIMDVYEKPRV